MRSWRLQGAGFEGASLRFWSGTQTLGFVGGLSFDWGESERAKTRQAEKCSSLQWVGAESPCGGGLWTLTRLTALCTACGRPIGASRKAGRATCGRPQPAHKCLGKGDSLRSLPFPQAAWISTVGWRPRWKSTSANSPCCCCSLSGVLGGGRWRVRASRVRRGALRALGRQLVLKRVPVLAFIEVQARVGQLVLKRVRAP